MISLFLFQRCILDSYSIIDEAFDIIMVFNSWKSSWLRTPFSMGYSNFYLYRSVDVKTQGSLDCDFFQGVSISRYIFQGVNLQSLPSSGWQAQKNFQVSFFSNGSNCLNKINSRGFTSQTILLSSRLYWFLKIWSFIPLHG